LYRGEEAKIERQKPWRRDPDGNGVELYWDKPKEEWPRDAEGNIEMYTRPADLGRELGRS
jgi:catechol-2,3-dioxygenase